MTNTLPSDLSSPSDRILRDEMLSDGRKRRRDRVAKTKTDALASILARNDLAPVLVLQEWAIADLKCASRRIRKADEAQIQRIANSIAKLGFRNPILVRKDGTIIDGHLRVEAMRRLGADQIAAIIVDDLSDTEIRALAIATNRLQERGAWNMDALRLEFQELSVKGLDLSLTGFEMPQIDFILGDGGARNPKADQVPAIATDVRPTAMPGDLFQCGPHLVLCADARDPASYLPLMRSELAHAALVDFPYNIRLDGFAGGKGKHKPHNFMMGVGEFSKPEFRKFLRDGFATLKANLLEGSVIGAFMDFRHLHDLIEAGEEAELDYLNMGVWVKGAGAMGGLYRNAAEFCGIFATSSPIRTNNNLLGKHGRNRSTVWEFAGAGQLGSSAREQLAVHCTPKPVEMLAEAILDTTNRGELVIDSFLGSGSTLVACETTGRVCRGIELDPHFVDVILNRWKAFSGTDAVHVETGLTFPELATSRAASSERIDPPASGGTDVG